MDAATSVPKLAISMENAGIVAHHIGTPILRMGQNIVIGALRICGITAAATQNHAIQPITGMVNAGPALRTCTTAIRATASLIAISAGRIFGIMAAAILPHVPRTAGGIQNAGRARERIFIRTGDILRLGAILVSKSTGTMDAAMRAKRNTGSRENAAIVPGVSGIIEGTAVRMAATAAATVAATTIKCTSRRSKYNDISAL